jgi:hypothetical protein
MQYLLSIVTTIQQYCNINNSKTLQSRLLQTLHMHFYHAIQEENAMYNNALAKLYASIYLGFEGRSLPLDFEKTVFDIVLSCLNIEMETIENHTMYTSIIDDGIFLANYQLTKQDRELLFFDTLGVKRFGDNYIIYHTFGNKECHISFDDLDLIKIAKLSETSSIEDVEKSALTTIKNVFKIVCTKFDNDETPDDTIQFLNVQNYTYALYDLKRAMDYLPVKACKNANMKFGETAFIYVSQDRLAVMYAILQNCISILTKPNKTIVIYKNTTFTNLIGGTDKPKYPNTEIEMNETIDSEYIEFNDAIPFDDLAVSENNLFTEFLTTYKNVSNKKHISFFWYVVYKTLFAFITYE